MSGTSSDNYCVMDWSGKMSVNDIIQLNVGGQRFETTRQTLLTDPQSMLGRCQCLLVQIPPPSNLYMVYRTETANNFYSEKCQ